MLTSQKMSCIYDFLFGAILGRVVYYSRDSSTVSFFIEISLLMLVVCMYTGEMRRIYFYTTVAI